MNFLQFEIRKASLSLKKWLASIARRTDRRLHAMRLEDRRLPDASFGLVAGILTLDGFDSGDVLQASSDASTGSFQFSLESGIWEESNGSLFDLSQDRRTLTVSGFGNGNGVGSGNGGIAEIVIDGQSGPLSRVVDGPSGLSVARLSIIGVEAVEFDSSFTDVNVLNAEVTELNFRDRDDLTTGRILVTGDSHLHASDAISGQAGSVFRVAGSAVLQGASIHLGTFSNDVFETSSLQWIASGDVTIESDSSVTLHNTSEGYNMELRSSGSVSNVGGSLAPAIAGHTLQVEAGGQIGSSDQPFRFDVDTLTTISGTSLTDGDQFLAASDDVHVESITASQGTVELHSGLFMFTEESSSSSQATAEELIVQGDAIVAGTGILDSDLRVDGSGILAPGADSGSLSVSDLILSPNSEFRAELQPQLPADADQLITVNGTVTIGSILNLTLQPGFVPVVNTSFTLIENDGSDPIQGTFQGLSEGASLAINNQLFVLTYQGGDGNDVVLSAGIPIYQFSNSVYQAAEGNVGTSVHPITILRSGNIQASTSVEIVVSEFPGDTTSSNDFVAQRILVSFAAGQTSASASVLINGDRTVERNESLNLTLERFSSGGQAALVNGEAQFVILNDDRSSLSIVSVIAAEGDGTTTPFQIDVTLSEAVQGGLSVSFNTVDGSATSAPGVFQDFEATSGVLTFQGNAGETQSVTVSVIADTWLETSEDFTLVLSNLSAGDPFVDAGLLIQQINHPATNLIINDDTEILVRNVGGDLVISDEAQGGADHKLTFAIDTSTIELVITSDVANLFTGSAEPVSSLRVPLSSVTGQVIVDMRDGNDVVAFRGDQLQTFEFHSDTVNADHGTVVIDDSSSGQTTIRLLSVEEIAVSSFSTVDVLTANGNDMVRIEDGTDLHDAAAGEALTLTSNSGGVDLPDLSIREVGVLTVSTTTVDGEDRFTIVSAESAHQIRSLELIAGSGTDLTEVQGNILFSGSLRIQSEQVWIHALEITTGGSQQFEAFVTLHNNVRLSTTQNGLSQGAAITVEEINADQNSLVIDAGIGEVRLANDQNHLSRISAYAGSVLIRNVVDLELEEILSEGSIELFTAGSVVDLNGNSANLYSATGVVSITAGGSVGVMDDNVLRESPVDSIEIDANFLAVSSGDDTAVQLLRSTELGTLRGDSLYFQSSFDISISTVLSDVRNLAIVTIGSLTLPVQTVVSGEMKLVGADLSSVTPIEISAQRTILKSNQSEAILFHSLDRLAGAEPGISGPDFGQIDVAVTGDLLLTLSGNTEVADLDCDGTGIKTDGNDLVLTSDSRVTQQAVSALENSKILSTALFATGTGQFDLINADNDVDRLAANGPESFRWNDIDDLEIGTAAGGVGVVVQFEFIANAVGDVLITASIYAGDSVEDVDSTSGELIQIGSRDGHLTIDGSAAPITISTDENAARSNHETGDQIILIADSDESVTAEPELTQNNLTEGMVRILGEIVVRTDGGVARQFGPRPQPGVASTAFFLFASNQLAVTSDNGLWNWEGFNAYLNAFEVLIGQIGEENLLFTIDWQDPIDETGVVQDRATQNHVARLGIDHPVSSERLQQFLIPNGDQTVQIGHIYTTADFTLFQRIQERTLIPVDFSVGHHPSVNVRGIVIQQGGVSEIVDGRDLASSDNVLTGDSQFENGVVVFTIPTVTPAPAALFATGAVPRNDRPTVPAPPETSAVPDRPVISEFTSGSAVESAFGTEVYFQIRRQFQIDGPAEIVIEKIVDRRLIGSREALERFVRSRVELQDGSGYEIWLVTETGGQRVERPIVEFEITGGRPGPAFEVEENSGETPQLRDVPFQQPEEHEEPKPPEPELPEGGGDNTTSTSLNGETFSDRAVRLTEIESHRWTRSDRLMRKYFR
ncbi:MAG: hypothetical protein JNL58_01820 [Planctomyces sp.]|nr:hypothetical protein [Planctomyces sp.]